MATQPSVYDPLTVKPEAANNRVLQFRVPNLQLCTDLEYVMRVLPLMTLQPLPKATARLCGLMNLQGESIPVVNVTNLLGQERQESYTIDTPILLCKYGDRKTALLVDEVVGIEEYKDSDLQRTETVTQKTLPVSGVLITSLGPTYILDIERIINFDYYSAPEAPDPQKLI